MTEKLLREAREALKGLLNKRGPELLPGATKISAEFTLARINAHLAACGEQSGPVVFRFKGVLADDWSEWIDIKRKGWKTPAAVEYAYAVPPAPEEGKS